MEGGHESLAPIQQLSTVVILRGPVGFVFPISPAFPQNFFPSAQLTLQEHYVSTAPIVRSKLLLLA
jgi:hypothetical protein